MRLKVNFKSYSIKVIKEIDIVSYRFNNKWCQNDNKLDYKCTNKLCIFIKFFSLCSNGLKISFWKYFEILYKEFPSFNKNFKPPKDKLK